MEESIEESRVLLSLPARCNDDPSKRPRDDLAFILCLLDDYRQEDSRPNFVYDASRLDLHFVMIRVVCTVIVIEDVLNYLTSYRELESISTDHAPARGHYI